MLELYLSLQNRQGTSVFKQLGLGIIVVMCTELQLKTLLRVLSKEIKYFTHNYNQVKIKYNS